MFPLTPGVRYLLATLVPTLLGPPCLIHTLAVVVSQLWPTFVITRTLLICIYIFTFPAYSSAKYRIARLKESASARRLGVRTAPRVEGILPGNIDLIYTGVTSGKTDYFGEPWLAAVAGHGKTFTIEVLGENKICTLNPKNIQKILATDFENYCKGPWFKGTAEVMLGDGVFNSDGEMWQFHRKMTRPFFSKERVTDLQLYERKAAIALQKMQDRLDDGMAVDFQDLASRFTMDSAAEFLLGASINSLDAPLALPYNVLAANNAATSTTSTCFAKAFATAQINLLYRMELGNIWPLMEILQDKMKGPMVEIRQFVHPIVRNAIAKHERGETKEPEEQTLLGHLVDSTDDEKVIADETLNIMLAGRDTTASLLTFVTYCLATHPDVLSRLRDEILGSIGSDRSPSYDDLRDMKYLRAVLNETLRLFPPVPFNVRETINETIWTDDEGGDLYVPGNTRLAYSVFHLHRDEEHWGKDAHIFDPDRWVDSRSLRYTSNPFIFMPFNAGPRICLGQQFAYHETSFFIVRLLQRFAHIELAPEFQPPKTRPPANWKDPARGSPLSKRRAIEKCFPRAHLTLYADGGLWIRARESKAPPDT